MEITEEDDERPCRLTLQIPFPTERLARIALGSLSVDKELSSLVRRDFLLSTSTATSDSTSTSAEKTDAGVGDEDEEEKKKGGVRNVLEVKYRATTNRMLRVAVNGFFDSLNVVVQVMRELDVDVLFEELESEEDGASLGGLAGVQGVEQGLTGFAGVVPD